MPARRGEHPRRAGRFLKPQTQWLRPAVHVPVARPLLGDHQLPHERGGAPRDVGDPLVGLEIDGHTHSRGWLTIISHQRWGQSDVSRGGTALKIW